jgi:alkylhydroperoxidase family enzyme
MHTRVAPVVPGTRPELADKEAAILAARGRISELYQVLLNSAPLAGGWEQMLSAVRNHSSVPADLREMAILRVAVLNRASYEFDAHVPHAQKAGIGQARIDALREPGIAAAFTATERLVIDLTDRMTRDIEVPDEVFEPLREHFDARALVELVATIAAYNMVSRFLVALRIGH